VSGDGSSFLRGWVFILNRLRVELGIVSGRDAKKLGKKPERVSKKQAKKEAKRDKSLRSR